MCNEDGNLLFYTNGCEVRNWKHELVENGGNINPGVVYDNWCPINGYPAGQSVITLTDPRDKTKYLIFHLRFSDIANPSYKVESFLYTTLRFDSPEDPGLVLEKNQLLLEGDFTDQLTAVRHGNGRDWWIVLPWLSSNRHSVFLLGPEGPKYISVEAVGREWSEIDYVGQATFSPDGSKYVRISARNGVNIFDFDRCAGKLSNPVHIDLERDTVVNASATGVAVSPNSRYLYASVNQKVLQFDLWAADIGASRVEVAYWDGFVDSGASTLFYQNMLAPNGKIYIVPPGGAKHLHTIHAPDEAGTACDLRQHDLELAAYESWGMPNFPHFRLLDLPGSPCDTIGIDGTPETEDVSFTFYPNPVGEVLNFEVVLSESQKVAIEVIDLHGRIVLFEEYEGRGIKDELSVPHLPAGMYIIQVRSGDEALVREKFIKI